MNHIQNHSYCKSNIKGKITFCYSLALLFCVYFSSAQDQVICDSEFNFFGVDMNENNGNGSTNSTYEWSVLGEGFRGEIIPQTSSENQIIIKWHDTPEGEYTIMVQEINSSTPCLPEPRKMVVELKDILPEDIMGPAFVCEGEAIALNHSFQEEGEWTLENDDIGMISQDGNFQAIKEGNVIVNFSYVNNECEFSVSKLIQVLAKPQPELLEDEICLDAEANEAIILDSGLPPEDYEFRWFHNNQLLPSSQNQIIVTEVGEYKLQVLNPETGCSSDIISTNVVQLPKPIITANVYTDFHDNQKIVININNPDAYLFKLEDREFQDSPIFYNITKEGTYGITIIEKEGCFVKEIEVLVINYPKFFTPNADGINDSWNIESLENDLTSEIFIFDRYGKLLKILSPAGEGWDGYYNGKRMPTDDYWFRVEYTNRNDGHMRTFRSNFTLKR